VNLNEPAWADTPGLPANTTTNQSAAENAQNRTQTGRKPTSPLSPRSLSPRALEPRPHQSARQGLKARSAGHPGAPSLASRVPVRGLVLGGGGRCGAWRGVGEPSTEERRGRVRSSDTHVQTSVQTARRRRAATPAADRLQMFHRGFITNARPTSGPGPRTGR